MKSPVSPHMVAFLIFGSIAPLSAQNPIGNSFASSAISSSDAVDESSSASFAEISETVDGYMIPKAEKAVGIVADKKPVYVQQDVSSLTPRAVTDESRSVDSVVDLGALENPSPYRKVDVSVGLKASDVSTSGLETELATISAAYRKSGLSDATADCTAIGLSVEQRVKMNIGRVLETVETEIAANPGCSCEIVKTAIKASDADVPLVVSIVETAINMSPENMRIISQCAIATMPEAVSEVQALLAKLDPNGGESSESAKSAQSSKSVKQSLVVSPILPNPLDLPLVYLPFLPPPILSPPVTIVNP